jgi:RNA polymerase sigma-70 factor (ECF subfamily)
MNTNITLSDVEVLKESREYPWMFGVLVERYEAAFLRKGVYILHSHDDAQDAVQDTFLKIYKYAHKFSEQEGASFQSWAYKILTNTCYSYASRKTAHSRSVKVLDSADLDIVGSTDNLLDKERASFVESVLLCLPRKLSRLLSLYFFEDKTYEEIAMVENLTLSAVRSGLHRAKKQFKNIAIEMQ